MPTLIPTTLYSKSGKLILHDAFSDANGTLIAAHTIAPINIPATSWTLMAGTADAQIQGNKGKYVATTSGTTLTLASGVSNFEISARFNQPIGSTINWQFSLVGRYVDPSNYWRAYWVGSPVATLALLERTGGVNATRTSVTIAPTYGSENLLKLTMNGQLISISVDGVPVSSYSSTQHQAATRAGFDFYAGDVASTGCTIDDFKVVQL